MKAATTSLFDALAQVPEICPASIKEPHYFSKDFHPRFGGALSRLQYVFSGVKIVRDPDVYESLFASGLEGSRVRLEASTSYLYSEVAPREIFAYDPKARIIILLRDPVERAWSEYRMRKAIGIERKSFREAIEEELGAPDSGFFLRQRYIASGRYGEHVRRFLDVFPREQVLIQVVDEPGVEMQDVFSRVGEFLGIARPPEVVVARENTGSVARFGAINTLIYYSGIRAVMGMIIPRSMKRKIKSFFYRSEAGELNEDDWRFCTSLFRDDVKKLKGAVDVKIDHWSCLR